MHLNRFHQSRVRRQCWVREQFHHVSNAALGNSPRTVHRPCDLVVGGSEVDGELVPGYLNGSRNGDLTFVIAVVFQVISEGSSPVWQLLDRSPGTTCRIGHECFCGFSNRWVPHSSKSSWMRRSPIRLAAT